MLIHRRWWQDWSLKHQTQPPPQGPCQGRVERTRDRFTWRRTNMDTQTLLPFLYFCCFGFKNLLFLLLRGTLNWSFKCCGCQFFSPINHKLFRVLNMEIWTENCSFSSRTSCYGYFEAIEGIEPPFCVNNLYRHTQTLTWKLGHWNI